MGYYTNYELEIIEGDNNYTDYKEEIGKLSEYGRDTFDDSIKWYDHEKDMKAYSKQHPNTVFRLYGKGEIAGDLWYKFFQNGKMQVSKAVIQFIDFDKNKLE